MKTAIIYARVSTIRQADDGLPVESQIEQGRSKAAELGATVLRVFRDDGVSARTSKRPEFQEAIRYCVDNRVAYMIVWSTSRFARNHLDAASYKLLLKKAGVKLVYVSQAIDTDNEDHWMFDALLEVIDEQHSRTISKDTRRSMAKNARDGYWNGGRLPFGFRAVDVGKRKRLEPEASEASLVTEIFREYIGGRGVKDLVTQLNGDGRWRRGKPWDKSTLTNLLRNPVYVGNIVFGRSTAAGVERPRDEWIVTNAHPAIVSPQIFAQAQETLQVRAPHTGGSARSTAIFTGLLKCGRCGSSLQTETATGRSRVYRYYNCRGALKRGDCPPRRLPVDAVDRWLMESVLDRIFTRDVLIEMIREIYELKGEWALERQSRIDSIVEQIQAAETAMRKIFELFEMHGKDTPNLADVTHRLRQRKDQVDQLRRKLSEVEADPGPQLDVGESDVSALQKMLRGIVEQSANPRKQREFFTGILKRVTMHADEAEIEYYPERILNRTEAVHSASIRWLPDRSTLRTAAIVVRFGGGLRRVA